MSTENFTVTQPISRAALRMSELKALLICLNKAAECAMNDQDVEFATHAMTVTDVAIRFAEEVSSALDNAPQLRRAE